ncbi:MAG: hypothetical protein K6A77_13615 [Clostridiales bacterium]|nr:hypothetical protein [Clostridiales bacterium]
MFDDQYYYKLLNARADARYYKEREQLEWIAKEMKIHKGPKEARMRYARSVAQFLLSCIDIEQKWGEEYFCLASEEQLKHDQERLYTEIMPERYVRSIWNPSFAAKVLGADCGPILSAVAASMFENIVSAYRHMRFAMHWNQEMFLNLFQLLNQDRKISVEEIRELMNSQYERCAKEKMAVYLHIKYDFQNRTRKDIIETLDWSDPINLYTLGCYVSEDARRRSDYMKSLSDEQIHTMADQLVQDFRRGFFQGGRDILAKRVVGICYPLGMERLVREVIQLFRSEIHYISYIMRIDADPVNPQYDADHANDMACLVDELCCKEALDSGLNELQVNAEMVDAAGGYAVIIDPLQKTAVAPVEPSSDRVVPDETQKAIYEGFQNGYASLINKFFSASTMSHAELEVPVQLSEARTEVPEGEYENV